MNLTEWVNNYIKEVTHSHEYEDMSQMGEDENDPQEIKVGNYQTKYFHVCPGASNLYKDIESKGVDMDMAERSVRLQDALFFVEEHIQRDGYKPERDYVMVGKNLAKNIMKLAEMMGLEKEHDYIQGHIDTIEKVVKEKGLQERVMELTEENVPTDPSKWSYYKSQAKKKFDVYPSAYANAWAAKQYKDAGGGWRTKKESVNEANAQLNKKVKSYLDDYLKDTKKNSPEHQEAIMLIMRGALTDANFHSEARQLSKYFPKAGKKYIGTPMEDVIEDKGIQISKWAKWDGYDIIDAFAFYTSMTIGGSFGAKFQSLKESINEAYIVTYAKKKGEKTASAAFQLRGSALSFERDLKKDGYITMVTQKKVKGVDESVNEEQINEWKLQLDLGKVNPSDFENWANDSLQKKHKIKVSGSGRNWTIVGKGNDDRMGSSADWISQLLGKAWKVNKIKVVQKESVNEYIEPQTKKIAYYTGTRPEAVKDFVSKHGLNITKLLKFVEKGKLPERMAVVSALAGRPGNPVQKKIIKQFSESINEDYYKSASDAADAARKYAEKKGFEIDEDDWQTQIAMGGKHNRLRPGVGKTHSFSVGLTKNGKPQRKALNISLYGMDSGKFELTTYIN